MKKIMFNDRYGLTDAVLNGTKIVTRRLINPQPNSKIKIFGVEKAREGYFYVGSYYQTNSACRISDFFMPPYKIGEIVAVAQSYYSIMHSGAKLPIKADISVVSHKGWCNKMFVRADLMPHQIRILDVRAERLHDITDEDCLREGVRLYEENSDKYFIGGLTNTSHHLAPYHNVLVSRMSLCYFLLPVKPLHLSSIKSAAKERGQKTLSCGA